MEILTKNIFKVNSINISNEDNFGKISPINKISQASLNDYFHDYIKNTKTKKQLWEILNDKL